MNKTDCGQDVNKCCEKYGLNCCQDCPIDEMVVECQYTKKPCQFKLNECYEFCIQHRKNRKKSCHHKLSSVTGEK